MIPTEVKVGHVFRYAYLWDRESREGWEEGEKDRPCLVLALVAIDEDGVRAVRVLPITHARPADLNEAIEIPPRVKQRLGLDDERSWIVLSESNRFVWPGPDLRPTLSESVDGYYGPLPPALFEAVKRGFVALARGGGHVSVARSE
ncbi:plasmid maintenance toxin (PemK-like) [Methylocystis sp. H62]|uniref:plasmid maintenance toxin (PemK-like) n=1 Tax=Methylocystis sp. H62 TaxID=2785789 RepID=UPI0018C2C6CE|nr:plasmid maintenance toxin (PemK-like) [Methylocystis sp. H62]MBG0792518.1 plasmid maintenance toxin (PemK-like) [Methylocystis sp. H62]